MGEKDQEMKDPVVRLNQDLKAASVMMSVREARFLVDAYYITQDNRIRVDGQIRSMKSEPTFMLEWLSELTRSQEDEIKKSLGLFAKQYSVGQWLQGLCGIGPVLSAAFLATLDIRDRPTCGHWVRFAGLDPTMKWEKGKKRPWNARLKVLCYKAGESFVKVQNNENDYYGKIFAKRRQLEEKRNLEGKFKMQAEECVKRYRKTTVAYKSYIEGKLPDAHLHARARRYAVKMFLSHLHTVMYRDYYGEEPPVPYVFSKLPENADDYLERIKGLDDLTGVHTHYVPPPEIPIKGGKLLRDLYGG
jgi:hypothetical protein